MDGGGDVDRSTMDKVSFDSFNFMFIEFLQHDFFSTHGKTKEKVITMAQIFMNFM